MAENVNDAKDAATPAEPGAPPAPAPAAAAKKAGGLALPLILGVAVAAAGAGFALGDFVVAPQLVAARAAKPENAARKAHGKGDKDAKTSVFKIDNVVVNPLGAEGARFVMASIAIEVPDDRALERLRDKDAQVRDLVTSVLESKSMATLSRPGARDALKLELTRAVEPLAGCKPRVYLPHFVIQ